MTTVRLFLFFSLLERRPANWGGGILISFLILDYSTVRIKKTQDELGSPVADDEDATRSRSSLPWLGSSVTKPSKTGNEAIFSDEEDSGDEESGESGASQEVVVSEKTEEKVVVAKIWMENYYDRLFKGLGGLLTIYTI